MSTEHSKGKARTTLPRSRDLQDVPAVGERHRNRDERGRALPGNDLGRGRGWKRAVTKLIGRSDLADPIATAVAEDAWRLFGASIRELPSDGATVRGLVASKARHEALAAFWTSQAVEHGLASPKGIAAQQHATKHGERAERLAISSLDVATRLAKSQRGKRPMAAPWLEAEQPDADPERLAGARSAPETTSDEHDNQKRASEAHSDGTTTNEY